MLDRRALMLLPPAMLLGATALKAQSDDPRLAERSLGRADAPVTAIEYFSLTCSHCGAFHRDTWPRVKRELVDTGRVRMVFRDFALDQVSLRAASTSGVLMSASTGAGGMISSITAALPPAPQLRSVQRRSRRGVFVRR